MDTSLGASHQEGAGLEDKTERSGYAASEQDAQQQCDTSNWRHDRNFYLAIISICAGTFMTGIAATSFVVIIPDIAYDIKLSSIQAFWLPTASTLCFVLSSFFTGPLSNVFGRRRIIILEVLRLVPASVLSGTAKNFATILVGRCFFGIHGGLVVLSEICITDMVPLSERGHFMSLIMIPWVIGNMLGPIVSGAIADRSTWRWACYFLAPMSGVCALLYFMLLKLRAPPLSFAAIRKFDFLGAAIFASGTISLVIGISWGGIMYAWSAWETILPIVVGIVKLAGFLVYEWKRPSVPLIQLDMLKQRTMWITSVGNLFYGVTFVQMLYLLPYYFMACRGMSVLGTGVAALAYQLAIFIASAISGPIMTRTASYRWCIILGYSCVALGFGVFTLLKPSTPTVGWIFITAVPGLGIGFLTMSQSYAVQTAAHSTNHDVGRALSLQWTIRTFGNALGLSIGGSALRNFLVQESRKNPLLAPQAAHYGEDASALAMYIIGLKESGTEGILKHALENTYALALRDVWYILLGMTSVVLVLSFGTQALSLDQVLATNQPLITMATEEVESE